MRRSDENHPDGSAVSHEPSVRFDSATGGMNTRYEIAGFWLFLLLSFDAVLKQIAISVLLRLGLCGGLDAQDLTLPH